MDADLVAGVQSAHLRIEPGTDRVRWQAAAGAVTALRLSTSGSARETLPTYVAQVDFTEDAAHAQPSAVGLDIARTYAVFRGGVWTPVAAASIREGDWVRITLSVSTAAIRHFVALTDAVPGGLQPTDLSLSGVGGLDLQAVADTGSSWFATRKLDARAPKFYAERLPAGRHEVHYFARAGNAGDYLAAPATAELMYGTASHARTAATRLNIAAP